MTEKRTYYNAEEYMDANYPPLPEDRKPRRRSRRSMDREPISAHIARIAEIARTRRSADTSGGEE